MIQNVFSLQGLLKRFVCMDDVKGVSLQTKKHEFVDEKIPGTALGESALAERESLGSRKSDPRKIGFAARLISARGERDGRKTLSEIEG